VGRDGTFGFPGRFFSVRIYSVIAVCALSIWGCKDSIDDIGGTNSPRGVLVHGWVENYPPRENVPGQLIKSFFSTAGEANLLREHFANVNITCTYIRMREPGKQGAVHE
jgi:hypothetical protein